MPRRRGRIGSVGVDAETPAAIRSIASVSVIVGGKVCLARLE